MRSDNKINDRIEEISISNEGYKMKIIKYNSAKDIIIEFQDKYNAKIHTNYEAFKRGVVKNPYHPSVYGVGCCGQGKYVTRDKNGKITKAYKIWSEMLKRCYDPYFLNKFPTYIDCYVCEEWLNFQNFAKWFYDNYYEIDGQLMCLDKDILFKNNKIYCPNNCIILPQRINKLFTKADISRGRYPIGVYYRKDVERLYVHCSIFDKENNKKKQLYLGNFPLDKPFQAFTVYKNFKENYIKQVADEYKDLIPQRLYDAMYNYEVEIND